MDLLLTLTVFHTLFSDVFGHVVSFVANFDCNFHAIRCFWHVSPKHGTVNLGDSSDDDSIFITRTSRGNVQRDVHNQVAFNLDFEEFMNSSKDSAIDSNNSVVGVEGEEHTSPLDVTIQNDRNKEKSVGNEHDTSYTPAVEDISEPET